MFIDFYPFSVAPLTTFRSLSAVAIPPCAPVSLEKEGAMRPVTASSPLEQKRKAREPEEPNNLGGRQKVT